MLATELAYRNHRNTAIKNRNESLLHEAFFDKDFFFFRQGFFSAVVYVLSVHHGKTSAP